MINKLIAKYRLWKDPPYKGDVFYGDAFNFAMCNAIEQRLHQMFDKSGCTRLWGVVPGKNTVRLTIEMDSNPYYRCTCEVLACDVYEPSKRQWLKRVQPRRISRERFHQMILDGDLIKQ